MAGIARWTLGYLPKLVLSGLGMLALAGIFACSRADSPEARRGKELFLGRVPLKARMVGHDMDLPSSAVQCHNCHRTAGATPVASAAPVGVASDSLGPTLNRETLTGLVPRRGGPPSRYDNESFCRVLSTAIDPAYVIVNSTMPRYKMSAADCGALWTYLTSQ